MLNLALRRGSRWPLHCFLCHALPVIEVLNDGICAALCHGPDTGCADEDREDIQAETEKQEDTFDHIGSALGDLKHMSNVSWPASLWMLCIIKARRFIRAECDELLLTHPKAWTQRESPSKQDILLIQT